MQYVTSKGRDGQMLPTCTPRMPKMMKKAQQMRTMLPMGFREVMRVSTTSFRPGALLITLREGQSLEKVRPKGIFVFTGRDFSMGESSS